MTKNKDKTYNLYGRYFLWEIMAQTARFFGLLSYSYYFSVDVDIVAIAAVDVINTISNIFT